jgi:hypothetical protein
MGAARLRKLEREEPLGRGEGWRLIETLWINLWSTCVPPVKIASGGSATALPRSLEKSPRELKTQEGTRVTPRIPIGTKTLRSTRRSLVPGNR